jgi:hypothetical protein
MVLDSLGAASDEPERDEPSGRHGKVVRNQFLNRFESPNDAD